MMMQMIFSKDASCVRVHTYESGKASARATQRKRKRTHAKMALADDARSHGNCTEKTRANHWPKRTFKLTLTGWSRRRAQQIGPASYPAHSSRIAKTSDRSCTRKQKRQRSRDTKKALEPYPIEVAAKMTIE